MTDWVDFFVYVVFILTIFFVLPWTLGKLSVPMLADRNADWVGENPETIRQMDRIGQWFLWLYFALGIASLTLLTMMQLRSMTDPDLPEKWMLLLQFPIANLSVSDPDLPEKWMLLYQLSMVSLFIGMLVFCATGAISHFLWMRKIPIAERRQANLQRRSIDDFVPLTVRLVTYLLIFIMLIAWVVVAVLGWHDDPLFWTRLVTMFALSGFFWFFTSYAIKRRPNVMDRLFGSDYRRIEVLLTFSCQLLTPVIGAVRLYEELADVIVVNINRAMFLGLALYIIVWMLWIGYLVVRNLPSRGSADNTLINIK